MFKNTKNMYEIREITNQGKTILIDRTISIFRIYPENIIGSSTEHINILYKSYLSYIRSLPEVFQIIVIKGSEDFNAQIENYNQKIINEENRNLKEALKKYIDYLKKIADIERIYTTKYFLITKNTDDNNFATIINNLTEFGAKLEEIKDKKEILKILKHSFNKEIQSG